MWVIFAIVIDQLIKLLVVSFCSVGEYVPLFPGLTITLAMNRGVAFSLFSQSSGLVFWLLNGVIVFFNWSLLEFLHVSRNQPLILRLCLMSIISGALSNLIDRICYGAVVDYVLLHVGPWTWPTIFNLADVFITFGCIGFCVVQFYIKRENQPLPNL